MNKVKRYCHIQPRLKVLLGVLYSLCILWSVQLCWLKVIEGERQLVQYQKKLKNTFEAEEEGESRENPNQEHVISKLPYLTQEAYGMETLLSYLEKESITQLHITPLATYKLEGNEEVSCISYNISYTTTSSNQQQLIKQLAQVDYLEIKTIQGEKDEERLDVQLQVNLWYRTE